MLSRQKAAASGRLGSRSGQSLVESCFVIALICLAFFGTLQVSQLFANKEILNYAANKGARAKTVGFNRFMVYKSVRVGAIPSSGLLLNPDVPGGPMEQYVVERARIPDYLATERWGELDPILDYDNWNSLGFQDSARQMGDGMELLTVRTHQDIPLWAPFHRGYYLGDQIEMTGESTIEKHYNLYLDDDYL